MKCIFLDRDGVINEDRPDYVKTCTEFQFLPGSLNALRLLTLGGYSAIVITNQSVINRNLTSQRELDKIHNHMLETVERQGGRIEAVYYCPHRPEDDCTCRKPEPGLIHRAQSDYGLDLSKICMIGDGLKDIECARRAGCGKAVLVRTGHGQETEQLCKEKDIVPDFITDDLLAAARWLLDEDSNEEPS